MQVRLSSKLAVSGVAGLVLLGLGSPAAAKRAVAGVGKRASDTTVRPIDLKQDVPGEGFASAWQRFSKRGAGQEELFVRFSAMTGAPRVIYGDLGEAPQAAKAEDRASLFLASYADVLGVDVREVVKTREWNFPESSHVYFDQKYRGLPVFYGEVGVHIGADGHVRAVTNTFTPVAGKSIDPVVGARAAFAAAVASVTDANKVISQHVQDPQLGIWPTSDGGRLAWRTVVPTRQPAGDFEIFVDANSGAVLGEPYNLMCTVDGVGKPYTISPVVSEANDAFRDNGSGATAVPESGYITQTLLGLDGSGKLIGPYSKVHPSMSGPAIRANNDFSDLRRGASNTTNSQFDEENVYWHIDKANRTFQELGYGVATGDAIMNYSIPVYAHNSPTWGNQDNSSFSGDNSSGTGTGILQFGTGGVDDAEDGEIVWHEYGHAVLWNQRPGISQNVSREGIGEGFGDYLAGAMSEIIDSDGQGTRRSYYETIGEWDATSYNPNSSPHPYLRPLTTATFWENRPNEVHDAGEVWSHPMFDYDRSVGVRVGLKTALRHNFLLDLNPTQVESANAMIQADMLLWGGATKGQVQSAFFERHTLTGTVTDVIHTIGVVLPNSNFFAERLSNTPGAADYSVLYGAAAWTKLAGDWDGDSDDTVGAYDPTTGTFFLKNANSPGPADIIVGFGPANAGWQPIVGDWDGDGDETIGLYEPTTSFFYLKNTNTPGPADVVFGYGPGGAGWKPIIGDWDGNGTDTPGLYAPASGFFFLRNSNSAGPGDISFGFGPANAGWLPIAGNWDADASDSSLRGKDSVGLYEPTNGLFFLKNALSGGPADVVVGYGPPNSTPLVGDWNGKLHLN